MPTSRATRKRTAKQARPQPAPRALTKAQVPGAVETLAAPSGSARFRAGKALVVTAERDPHRVYPHFDTLAALLASDSKIVRWNALQILSLLAPADAAHKLDNVLDTILGFIRGDNMVSAANAIQGAARIAHSRPDLLGRILPAILAVEHATYETDECRNVAIGHALKMLEMLGPSAYRQPAAAAFIRRQMANTRAKVARQATRLTAQLT